MSSVTFDEAPVRDARPPASTLRPTPAEPAPRSRLARLALGASDDPAWARPGLWGLLLATAVLYLWGLGASGYANTFYSAAVQAGTHSWKAAFFGASDAAGSITVDKSPLSLWPMEIVARIFGVSGWSILVPQALEGVAAVALLHAAVKRTSGHAAGLVAGAVMALTPVATLMFRFNNPDAMMVLLLTGAGYAIVRALEKGQTRWVTLAFSLVGLGFLAKMLQAFLVLPALGLVYLLAGPPQLWKRIWQLALAGVALVASFGWWVAIVELWPASSRPYIGGSQNNSVINLILGYNGFGRLTGNETGSVGGGGGGNGGGGWGATGWNRLFNSSFGGQASWLIPSALLLLGVGAFATLRRHRTDKVRAGLILWGGWLLVTGAAISFGQGIIHEYYTVALAPGIGGTLAVGGAFVWSVRHVLWARLSMAAAILVGAWWSATLLHRTPTWHSWLQPTVVGLGAAAALLLAIGPALGRKVLIGAVLAALGVGLIGPAAYSLSTVTQTHNGALPTAGPAGASRGGMGGRGGPGGGGFGGPPQAVGGTRTAGGFGGGAPGGMGGGGVGGLLNGSTSSAELTAALLENADSYTWVAATVGANSAAGYQLATDRSVMPIGGFNGTDPSPTLAEFKALVADGKIHYLIGGGGGMGGRGGQGSTASSSSAITSWVTSTFATKTVGSTTLYDLTAPLTS